MHAFGWSISRTRQLCWRVVLAGVTMGSALSCSGETATSPMEPGAPGAGGAGGSNSDAMQGDGTGGVPGEAGPGATITVQPTEIDDLFANPGMGWQTFHSFANTDPTLAGLPSGSAYFRWTWKDLEPTNGTVNAGLIKDTLAKARAAGQTLMFRVMTAGDTEEYSPDWLASAGCKVMTYQCGGPTVHTPDLDDPGCYARLETLLTTVGHELEQDRDIEVDIGTVGLWGEWHFSGTTPQVPMPSLDTRKRVVDLHRSVFPNVPLAGLVGDVDALAYAVSKGAGWRADCLGDYGFFSPTWNHMDNLYKQNVQQAGATDAWQKGPVAWESCYWMAKWVEAGYDVHKIFQYALDMHGSFVNDKSTALPAGQQYRQEVESLLRKLGYRLVLRSLAHPTVVVRGSPVDVTMVWDNVGVAPPYGDYRLAIRLLPEQPSDGGRGAIIAHLDSKPSSWLPGSAGTTDKLVVDSSTAAGAYGLSVGVVDAADRAVVRLAIAGRDSEGWYPVSSVIVR